MDFVKQNILIGVAIAATAFAYPDIFLRYFNNATGSADSYAFKDSVQIALTNYQSTGSELLKATLTLIAGSWGVIAVSKEASNTFLGNWRARFIFCMSTLCLLFSSYSYLLFSNTLTYYLQKASEVDAVPDLLSGHLTDFYQAQIAGAALGGLCIGLTIFHKWLDE